MKNIKIVMASDDKYAQHLGVLIVSILYNSTDEESFTFYILDGGISEQNRLKIERVKKIKEFHIEYLTVDWSLLASCPDMRYYSKNTFSRLLIPEMLPHESRVIYLDVDIIVKSSLSEFWDADMQGRSIGCIEDSGDSSYQKNILGLEDTFYFNAGVLLINLDRIRQYNLFQKTLMWIDKYNYLLIFPDQDALNVVFHNDKIKLESKWNYRPSEKNSNPYSIIHYSCESKPWSYMYTGYLQEEYLFYQNLSPWKDVSPSDKNIKNRIRKLMMPLMNLKNWLADFIAHRMIKHSKWLQNTLSEHQQLYDACIKYKKMLYQRDSNNSNDNPPKISVD